MPHRIRTGGFAALPYGLMDDMPEPSIWCTYLVLHRHGWASEEGAWVSVRTIAKEAGIGHHSVRSALHLLVSHGWVEACIRPGYTTVYTVRMDAPSKNGTGTPFQNRKAPPSKNGRGTPSKIGTRTRTPLTTTPEQQPIQNTLCQTAPPAGSAPGQAGRKERKLRTTGSPDFEAFWRRYNQLQPRSASSKPKALAAWNGAINAVGGRLEALLDALERHAADVHRAKVSGQFMPELPSCQKWLSEARWETVAAAADANTHHAPSSNGHHLTTSHGMIHL